ncbi:neurogenic locus notch homolog protein 2-like [Saccostrea cucullata]|uniref:neurogenic locus notch homolog protein 2-like n=1 Tax=Saccostrea cuccullata TaxID=36930 RepID=UPI002ED1EA3F
MAESMYTILLLLCIFATQIVQGRITFYVHVHEVQIPGNKLQDGSCCQDVTGSNCTKLCKPVLTVCLRNDRETCKASFTTTLDMNRDDVVYGSKLGNATNPLLFSVDDWIKYTDQLIFEVRDMQNSSSPLIFHTEVNANSLLLGRDIFTPYYKWETLVAAPYLHNNNTFRIRVTYKAFCSEGYYGSGCRYYCPGNPQKCVIYRQTYCKTGWHGTNCDEDFNECDTADFCRHGNCTNTIGGFHCSCPISSSGLRCRYDGDECIMELCNGGECVNQVRGYECLCKNGTMGKNCENLTDTQCSNSTCNNHGSCSEQDGRAVCSCIPGYTGADCSFKDFCYNNLCQHESTCVNGKRNYTCHCPKGLMGPYCKSVDHCASNPCLNSGICTNTLTKYQCECVDYFFGTTCSEYNYCGGNCSGNGICHVVGNGHNCTCNPGFRGKNCEYRDYCVNISCSNHGDCYSASNGFICYCNRGFGGKTCNLTKYCKYNSCSRPFICNDYNNNSYTCECPVGLYGSSCQYVDRCHKNPCGTNGKCLSQNDTYQCTCNSGWTGFNCSEADFCSPNPCQDNGNCSSSSNNFTCSCETGWVGRDCSLPDPCQNHTCINGEKCSVEIEQKVQVHTGSDPFSLITPSTAIIEVATAKCHCPGLNCSRRDYCASFPCMNNGTCTNANTTFLCTCSKSWYGKSCSFYDFCSSSPCSNGGVCRLNSQHNDFSCECTTGWVGKTCQSRDACLATPCVNNGICANVNNSYFCTCPSEWTGKNCQYYNYCTQHPCGDNSTCVSHANSYSCKCEPGFMGQHCDIIDRCHSHPCLHNGTCILEPYGYRCHCLGGYTGDQCERDLDECTFDLCPAKSTCYNKDGGYECVWNRSRRRRIPEDLGNKYTVNLSVNISTFDLKKVIADFHSTFSEEFCSPSQYTVFKPIKIVVLSSNNQPIIFQYYASCQGIIKHSGIHELEEKP